uniref:Neurotransmitter-gated ion-channel ligand-binding domain-containing protein n=1 Tax=Panagrolaimus sp. JU765 TaxID=591449 RepID=A0AC34RJN6_9BILA
MFFRIFLLLFLINLSTCNEDEQRLYADLLNNYNPLERPVENSSEPLIVKVRLFLQQIIDVDEKNQMVQVNAWIRYIWEDYKLKWNPDDYGGIRDVRFPGNLEQIWKPDVLLYNSADQNFDTTFKSNQLVYHTGEVNWIPPGILKFTCPMVITWFPFDDQVCRLKFGSWTYHGFALDLQVDSDDPNSAHQMDLSDYVINGEWNLLASPAIREVSFYKCCPEPYPTIIFSMHIRRRTLFYWFNLIIPSLLVSMMTIFSFSFPPDAGEKMNLGEF